MSAFLTPVPLSAHPLRVSLATPLRAHRRPNYHRIPRTTPTAKLHLPTAQTLITRAAADTNILLNFTKTALATLSLAALLSLPTPTLAAQGGGRIGGSSFRAPRAPQTRSYTSPRPTPGPSYYGPSYAPAFPGFYMSPFIMPGGFGLGLGGFGGFGGVFLLAAAAAFLLDAAKTRSAERDIQDVQNPVTAVAVVKVALLANARELQVALDGLARSADTTTVQGLRYVLRETATSLLRNPDYWTHASVSITAPRLASAEAAFESAALEERLKLGEETLSNTSGMRRETARAGEGVDLTNVPGEYIIVSIVAAASGALVTRLPKTVDGDADVRRALSALAAVGSDDLQAVEVVWAPQSLRDVLTEQELLQDHPELRRI